MRATASLSHRRIPPAARAAALTLLLCPLFLAGCGSPEQSAAGHMQRGQRYLSEGNLRKAQVEFNNAMQILPGRADARVMSGEVDEQLGNPRDALALYQSAIDADPGYVPARVHLGKLYVLAGAPEQAITTIGPALLQHPDDPDLLAVRGAARAALKDPVSARADAGRAVRLDPGNEDAVGLLAGLYRQNGELPRAVQLLQAALERRPGSAPLRLILADLYEQQGRADLAQAQWLRVVALQPQQFQPRRGLAAFYSRAGRPGDAERVLREAIAALPDEDAPKLAYVDFLTTLHSPAVAERALAQLIARDPGDYDLQLARGALLMQGNQPDTAAATYRDIAARAGDAPAGLTALDRLAAVLVMQRRFDEAAALIAQVLAKSERDVGALELRSDIALARGQTAAAVTDLRTVLRDQPHSAPVLRALASAYAAGGQLSLAEDSLRNALDAAPEDTATRMQLARLLMRTGRPDAATAALQEVLRSAPQDAEARELLVRLLIAKPDLDAAQKAADAAAGDWHRPYLQALVAQARHQPAQASRDLERALASKPDAVPALEEISRLEVAAGHASDAVARLQSLAAGSTDAAVHNLLGRLLVTAKDPRRAAEELGRAVVLAPTWWEPYHNLASVQLAQAQPAAAIGTYERGVAATHMELRLVTSLGSLYEQQGRAEDAIRLYESFCREFPGISAAANNLAMLLVTFNRDPASLERARDLTARFMQATDPELLDTAGWVRLKSGDVTAALPALEEAVRRAPGSHLIRYHLGMAQLQAGQREQARASLEAALAGATRFSGWDEARSALARMGS